MAKRQLLGDFEDTRRELDGVLSQWVAAIDSVLFPALRGDRLAARTYATAFVEMSEVMCRLVSEDSDERLWLQRIVRREAVTAPFRACLIDEGPGLSVAMRVLGDIRHMVPEAPELRWPKESCKQLVASRDLEDQQVAVFDRLVDRVIDSSVSPLEEVIVTFDLSYTDAGRLFGVSRQAITQWLAEGPPVDRQSKIVTAAQIASLLTRNLISERIPGIARKGAAQYGGRSMLEMIADGDHEELLELTRRSFDWAATA